MLKISRDVWGASPMHLTKSLDYAIIMDGEQEMLLDDGSASISSAIGAPHENR